MAVSRRLRFEIYRRDGHTCRYCGAMAPDVKLTIDHVIPITLGGTDDPNNLVTACDDCNGGKSSIAPDAPLVTDVAADTLRWRRAIEQARVEFDAERQLKEQMLEEFKSRWENWTYEVKIEVPAEPVDTGDPIRDNWHNLMGWEAKYSEPLYYIDGQLGIRAKRGYTKEVRAEAERRLQRFAEVLGAPVTRLVVDHAPEVEPPPPQPGPTYRAERRTVFLDPNWCDSISRFLSSGLTIDDLVRLVEVAMRQPRVKHGERFRYFCGCCWREITDLQESARRIIESQGSE